MNRKRIFSSKVIHSTTQPKICGKSIELIELKIINSVAGLGDGLAGLGDGLGPDLGLIFHLEGINLYPIIRRSMYRFVPSNLGVHGLPVVFHFGLSFKVLQNLAIDL